MTGLQEAFYIIGIVFMVVCLGIIIAMLIAIGVIRSKINSLHDTIENKFGQATGLVAKGGKLAKTVAGAVRQSK